LSWSPCTLILAAIYVDLAREPRCSQPHPVTGGPLRAVGFAIVLTARSNHQRVSEAEAARAVACLFKDAGLRDVTDYVRQVVTAPPLGAGGSLSWRAVPCCVPESSPARRWSSALLPRRGTGGSSPMP
jgi:hypothetical protein